MANTLLPPNNSNAKARKAVAASPAKQACPARSMCIENSAGKKLKKRFHREDLCRTRLVTRWNPDPQK
jgi:hypothetical protein